MAGTRTLAAAGIWWWVSVLNHENPVRAHQMTMPIAPLQRATFNAGTLMAEVALTPEQLELLDPQPRWAKS